MEKYSYSKEELSFIENSMIPFGIYQFINKRVVTVALSGGLLKLMGYSESERDKAYELMDYNMYRNAHPDDLAALGDSAYRFATEGGVYDVIYRVMINGEYRIIHSYGQHIYKEDGTRLAFVWYSEHGSYVEDNGNDGEGNELLGILKNGLAERSFHVKVGHDYLTGLPSMSYFLELAEAGCREIRKKGKTPAILFMDFEGMKVFNQKRGLEDGDRFLRVFADKIIALLSHENCSRFSADHFCAYIDEEKAKEVAEKLIKNNDRQDAEDKLPLRIGLYIYSDESITISGACDRAKIACNSGRNNYASRIYLFENSMMTYIENKQYIVENIDKAINQGWIQVYYQPIIKTATGKVCHEEALARWVDPVKGFLSPAEFIPALEESNSIYKLDLFVVESVIKKMKEQAANGLKVVTQSVNLSRSDFYTCDIVEEIRKRVDEAGIHRKMLAIEITESSLADDLDYMIKEIYRLKELGFYVWMDDYGSGYSSPSILARVPFDCIKIDMLFVRQLDEGDKPRIILTQIVKMAKALGIDTIAEGVETKEQVDFLSDIGCTMLQGFYFSKAISFPDILERYRKGIQIGFDNPGEPVMLLAN